MKLRHAAARWSLACALVSLLPFFSSAAVANPDNAGFEDGTLGGAPIGWNLTATANETIVVGSEDGGDFSIYGPGGFNTTVSPFRENLMLRLGTPESPGDRNNNQNNGLTTVSQRFEASASSVTLAIRIFSTEFRKNRDSFKVRLVDDFGNDTFPTDATNGGPLAIDGSPCPATPCSFPLDAGRNGDIFDSGWVEFQISNLSAGNFYTLSYELKTSGGSSHPSWGYADAPESNRPPEVSFIYAPGNGVADSAILEGDLITLLSEAVDPDGDDLALTWFVNGEQQAEGAVGLVAFPQNGNYQVRLEASDGENVASAERTIEVRNAPPLVQPLTVELAADGAGQAVCNWLDPGIEDQVSVTISLPGISQNFLTTTPNREIVPALASGQEILFFDAAALSVGPGAYPQAGNCTVSDGESLTSVDFDVVVLTQQDIDAREAVDTDSTSNAPLVIANAATVGRLATAEDIDVYRVCLANDGYTPDAGLANLADCDASRVSDLEIQQLPSKSKVLITLESPGADYDLLAFVSAEEETPFKNAPFIGAPFIGAPFIGADFENAPFIGAVFGSLPFIGAPFIGAPFIGAPFIGAPFIGAEYKVSPFIGAGGSAGDVSSWAVKYRNVARTELFGAPDGSVISGVDTPFTETGSDSLQAIATQNVQFVGLSANIDGKEQLVVEINPAKSLFIVVAATNGSVSSAPYTMTNQVSVPIDPVRTFGQLCDGSQPPYIPAGIATSTPEVVYPIGVDASAAGYDTYILTQRQRFQKAYDLDDAEWNQFIADLGPYLDAVNAKVVSVPSTWFDAADQNICDVPAQNLVAETIRDYLQSQLEQPGAGTVEYVQMLGSYQVIPPYFVPEETTILNESLYAPDLLTTPSALSFAYGLGYNAIDGYYTTFEPIPYRGRFLYVEDLSVSRLLETPEEILATALGQLIDPATPVLADFAPNGGIVTDFGYDFFRDATTETAANFTAIPGLQSGFSLNSDSILDPAGGSWTADDFRCYILGNDVPGCAVTESPEISVANFHASHNACLPARDFEAGVEADDFAGADIVRVDEVGDSLVGKLFTGIGCHSLLSVADSWVPDEIENLDLPVSLGSDWAQQPGTKIGPQGFGSGHDVQLRGSELVATLQAEEMANGWAAGPALVRAKQRYVASLVEVSPNDEDAVINHAISGVAQAKIAGTPDVPLASAGGTSSLLSALASSTGVSYAGGQLDLHIFEDGVAGAFSYAPILEQRADHPQGWGRWWTLDGVASAITNRTLLPRYTPSNFDFRTLPKTPDESWIHGVVLTERNGLPAARYVDVAVEDAIAATDADPVFPVEKHDWIKNVLEPQPCVETLAPTQLASAGVFRTRNEARQTLSIVGAQFRCRPEFAEPVTREINGETKFIAETRGDFRVFTGLTLQALHPVSAAFVDDFEPVEVLSQNFIATTNSQDVQATVSARDDNGIRSIIFLVYRPVDCDDPNASADYGAECAEGRAGFIDAEEVEFPTYPTSVTVTQTLTNAKGLLFAVQYVDVGGQVLTKSLKGTLQRAVEVDILNTTITLTNSDLEIFVEDLVNLQNLVVTTTIWQGQPDSGETPLVTSYELNDPANAGLFEIDPLTNTLTLLNIDLGPVSESTVTIEVVVQAQGASGEDTATVVTDVIPPAITSGGTADAIDENSGAGQIVYTATATDDNPFTWSLEDSGDVAAFSIDATSGAVTLDEDPDFETQPSYSFTVVATDEAGNESTQLVTLAINDLDENPPVITSGSAAEAIDENSGPGQVVYTGTATDENTVSWSLEDSGDATAFSIDETSGAVTLDEDPDFETQDSYTFAVVATDEAGNESAEIVELLINDLDENPPVITSDVEAEAIDENSGAGQVVYTGTATDENSVSWSLEDSGDVNAFSINETSGAVTLDEDPDFEIQDSYSFTVVATDEAGNESTQLVALAINDLDENPPVITSGSVAVAIDENSGPGQVVYTGTATDENTVSWSLEDSGDATAFSIDETSGAVTLGPDPDFETKASYTFTVIAADEAGNETTQLVTLAVNDLDENPPVITSGGIAPAIDENSGPGQLVYTAIATDESEFSWSLDGSDATAFSINAASGAVVLLADPNFETKASYAFTVVATDVRGNESTKPVTLAINDLDENPPVITSGSVAPAIDENSGPGQLVYTATATDESEFSWSLGGSDAAAFNINASTGAVVLGTNPDFELKSSYAFTVIATDVRGNESTRAVTLAINDVDENPPVITSGDRARTVNENSGANQQVYTATATDESEVTWSLANTGDASKFSINATSGVVTLLVNPDDDDSPLWFTVVATDEVGNSSSKAVRLRIRDDD